MTASSIEGEPTAEVLNDELIETTSQLYEEINNPGTLAEEEIKELTSRIESLVEQLGGDDKLPEELKKYVAKIREQLTPKTMEQQKHEERVEKSKSYLLKVVTDMVKKAWKKNDQETEYGKQGSTSISSGEMVEDLSLDYNILNDDVLRGEKPGKVSFASSEKLGTIHFTGHLISDRDSTILEVNGQMSIDEALE